MWESDIPDVRGKCREDHPLRTSDADILIIPGLGGGGPDHWYARWEARLSTARRILPDDPARPDLEQWRSAIAGAVATARRPVVFIAHSLGALAVAHAARSLPAGAAKGAMLVAPPSEEAIARVAEIEAGFAPIPRDPLPFPSWLVASRSDPWSDFAASEDLALAWGARLLDAGDSGHINDNSGHGPWPEGLMSFAGFMKSLG